MSEKDGTVLNIEDNQTTLELVDDTPTETNDIPNITGGSDKSSNVIKFGDDDNNIPTKESVSIGNNSDVIPVEEEDVISVINNKYTPSFKIDDDYLKTDYRSKAAEYEAELSKVKDKNLLPEAAALNEFIVNGGNPLDFFRAQVIDKDSIPEDIRIVNYLKRLHPSYDEDMINYIASTEYGVGQDMDDLKDIDEGAYFNSKIKRIGALEAENKYLDESKVQLSTPPQQIKQPTQEEYTKMVNDFQTSLVEQVSIANELAVGDKKFKVNGVSDIVNNHIAYEKDGITYLNNIPASEAAMMIALWKNRDFIFKHIRSEINVNAEIKADDIYNNSKSVQERSVAQNGINNGEWNVRSL